MRLLYDHGTLVLADPPDHNLSFLPGVRWDRRVALWRAPGYCYRDILEELERKRLPFVDEVQPRAPDPSRYEAVELRPYQQAALLAWQLAEQRGIAVMPTGSGKTRVAVAAMAALSVPTLCLVPTRALLHQWRMGLKCFYPGPLGCLGDGERQVEAVTVATFESAYRWMPEIGARFQLLVVDEAHHFGNGVKDEALELCIAPFRLGLTATPPDEPALGRLWQLIGAPVYRLGVGDLRGTYLADFELVVLRLLLTETERAAYDDARRAFNRVYRDYSRSFPRGGWEDFVRHASQSRDGRGALAAWHKSRKMLGLTSGKARALDALLARHRDGKVLIFTADNDAAYAIAKKHLIMPITCDISRTERKRALDAFRRGELRALVSARVLNEGIDVPDADVAIVVAGTQGEREHVQRVGRLLRPAPGKRAIVYELVTLGTSETHQAARRRRGLAPASATQS